MVSYAKLASAVKKYIKIPSQGQSLESTVHDVEMVIDSPGSQCTNLDDIKITETPQNKSSSNFGFKLDLSLLAHKPQQLYKDGIAIMQKNPVKMQLKKKRPIVHRRANTSFQVNNKKLITEKVTLQSKLTTNQPIRKSIRRSSSIKRGAKDKVGKENSPVKDKSPAKVRYSSQTRALQNTQNQTRHVRHRSDQGVIQNLMKNGGIKKRTGSTKKIRRRPTQHSRQTSSFATKNSRLHNRRRSSAEQKQLKLHARAQSATLKLKAPLEDLDNI